MTHTEFIDAICSKVDSGARFMVNLEKRTLRLNGRLVNLDEVDVFPVDEAVMFRCIVDLYWQYRHSVTVGAISRRCPKTSFPTKT